jgi:hypothetical protein
VIASFRNLPKIMVLISFELSLLEGVSALTWGNVHVRVRLSDACLFFARVRPFPRFRRSLSHFHAFLR